MKNKILNIHLFNDIFKAETACFHMGEHVLLASDFVTETIHLLLIWRH